MTVSIENILKWRNRSIIFSFDLIMTLLACSGAAWIVQPYLLHEMNTIYVLGILILQCVTFFICGLYRGVWRFASIPDLIRILRAVIIGVALSAVFLTFNHISIPLQAYIVYCLLIVISVSAPRLIYRYLRDYRHFLQKGKKVLIIGGGSAGEKIIRELHRSRITTQLFPVAIVDDNLKRLGSEIHGIRIIGSCQDIPHLVKKLGIELILIAIPSANSLRMREIVNLCEKVKIPFRTLPGIKDITNGLVNVNSIREVMIDDLLGREEVMIEWDVVKHTITEKTILVTGAGGSIGSELCKQICQLNPSHVIIVDNNEFNLYAIDLELRKKFQDIHLITYLSNVTDKIEMAKIFNAHHPHLVFHVAAYKHVPLLETHLRVAMQNNIIGTKITAELSSDCNVEKFVLISTDKAVNPKNIMGATKRAAEVFCQNLNTHSTTQFLTVRFGNVLNSTGSVLPLFRKQLIEGGPITVTHPEITRYFMTISEACQLILQAATMGQKNEIFVLDMGEPIQIRYLAEQLITLSGKEIGKDIQIQYTGLRPGEKLHEELFHEHENIQDTYHPKIKQAKIRFFSWTRLMDLMNQLEEAYKTNNEMVLKQILFELVPEYTEQVNRQEKKDRMNPHLLQHFKPVLSQ